MTVCADNTHSVLLFSENFQQFGLLLEKDYFLVILDRFSSFDLICNLVAEYGGSEPGWNLTNLALGKRDQ